MDKKHEINFHNLPDKIIDSIIIESIDPLIGTAETLGDQLLEQGSLLEILPSGNYLKSFYKITKIIQKNRFQRRLIYFIKETNQSLKNSKKLSKFKEQFKSDEKLKKETIA